MDAVTLLSLSFLAGVYAPLGSPCVLVLYPGYIAFLAGSRGEAKDAIPTLIPALGAGAAVAAGVIVSLCAGGLLFTSILALSGGEARVLITAGLFALLLVLSLFLVLDIGYERLLAPFPVPRAERPLPAAFLWGLTFGLIIIPCNAAAIAVLLAFSATATGFFEGLASFLCFGIGITLPLLLIAGISQVRGRQVTGFLQHHSRAIRAASGLFMLAISVYYLVLLVAPWIVSC